MITKENIISLKLNQVIYTHQGLGSLIKLVESGKTDQYINKCLCPVVPFEVVKIVDEAIDGKVIRKVTLRDINSIQGMSDLTISSEPELIKLCGQMYNPNKRYFVSKEELFKEYKAAIDEVLGECVKHNNGMDICCFVGKVFKLIRQGIDFGGIWFCKDEEFDNIPYSDIINQKVTIGRALRYK